MKIFAFLSLFFLALPVTMNAQEELLKFEHPLIDAGTMTEDDAPRTFTFVGKNVSKKILHITQVRTTCGCTSSYVRGDVMKPGDTCQVQITFTPNRYPGTINTGAYLYLKEVEGQPAVKLALTGKVLPGADQWARYPHKMGALRLKQAKASITEVKPGTEPEARILCGNSGDKPLRISSLLLPPYARLTTEPEVIEPGDEADLVITIIADKIPATMPESFTFPVILEGLDARPSDRTIQVVVKVKGKKEKVKRKNTKTMKYLKKLFTLLVIALFACGFAACSSDDEEPEEPSLEVTPANLHGTWKLAEWNGEPLAEGTYCYIVFNRKDQTFEMYQKFDSMYGRHITGSFAIKNDPYQGYIISGSYDNGKGDWNQSYLVTRLLASGSMIWTAKDDVTDISRYKRCDEVPAEILKECKDLTEE